MFFLDSIDLLVSSGKGGNGSISFSGSVSGVFKKPDGGNGGAGGDVYFIGDKNLKTFNSLNYNINYKAEDGANGKGNRKTGKNGSDLFIRVPLGTIVYDVERSLFFGEILVDGACLLVLKGGRGGYGNFFLKSCDDIIFDRLIVGGESKIMHFHLELRTLSDIGLLGFPNAGKSFFITRVSNVVSKVAEYAFTTLHPVFGVVSSSFFSDVLVADLPGIVKNSSHGVGKGFSFLKHISKTKLLLHIIDVSLIKSNFSLLRGLVIVNNELNNYNINFSRIEKWLVFNKIDLVSELKFSFSDKKFLLKFGYTNFFFISAKDLIGIKKLRFNINEFFSSFF
jgi:GTP-binding protein